MAHVSVVKKLERCERIGRERQTSEAMLNHVIKYKIKITNPPACKLLHMHSPAPSSPSLPCKLPLNVSLQNLHNEQQQTQLQSLLQQLEDDGSSFFQLPWELHDALQEQVISKTSSHGLPGQPLMLQQSTVLQEDEDASFEFLPWQLRENFKERGGDIRWAPKPATILQPTAVDEPPEEAPGSPYKLQKAAEEERQLLRSGEDEREGTRSPWKLQNEIQEKAGRGLWEAAVKRIECECCGMAEECTGGYEESVRERLRGHWLCGLCQDAVGEERKRVGGSMQAALVAHMQPCRRFSRRARAKASPPPSDVAVPHAVCRLLCRHLSTPSPRRPTSSPSTSLALSRSSSCIPSLPKS